MPCGGQVLSAEFVRPRIVVGVGRGDDAIVADGGEVGRDVGLVQPFADGMAAARELEQMVAANRRAAFEAPQADAGDVQRPAARLENQPQPIGHRRRGAGLARCQLGQGVALRREPPLALAQLVLRLVGDVEQPVDGVAQVGEVGTGAAGLQPRRPVVGLENLERPAADLVDAADQPHPVEQRHQDRDPEDQAADEQHFLDHRRRPGPVQRPLHEVEADEAGDQRDDDGESGLEHRGRGGTGSTARRRCRILHFVQPHILVRGYQRDRRFERRQPRRHLGFAGQPVPFIQLGMNDDVADAAVPHDL